jgi:hypothetical protein
VTIEGVLIGELDLLTTCTHHSELKVITALSLISTPINHYTLSLFPACCVSKSRSLATASNSGNSSCSKAHIGTVWRISRNWTLFFTAGLSTNLITISCRAKLKFQPQTDNLQLNSLSRPGVLAIQHRGGHNRKHRLQQFLYFVMCDCLAIARMWLTCLPTATKQRMFLLAIVAKQRYYTLQYFFLLHTFPSYFCTEQFVDVAATLCESCFSI